MKLLALPVYFLLTTLALADLYRPPNMDKKIFKADKIEMDKISRTALFSGLVSVASDFNMEDHEVDFELRSNALAIAGRLDPESERFKDTANELKQNGRTISEGDSSKSDISSKIYRGIRVLMREVEKNEDNKKCASYCIDIALRLDPEGRYAKKLEGYQKDTGEADWKDMLGVPVNNGDGPEQNEFKERTEIIPAGEAKEFKATQRTVFGLLIRTLSNGRNAGSASSLSATALREKDIEDVELHIDQKVGNMFGGSLTTIQRLMRVRHEEAGRIPAGYKVEINFENRDGLVDGPSAGTAMSIIIDSLFTGLELDDKFAVTGAITADGKVTAIGGVAGKIRGATRKGCNLVGVPDANVKGVYDILVLDGIEKLMAIQVFSFKTLDEALMVAAKDKPEHVQQTIDDFNKVVDLIKAKGAESLKSPSVIALLEDVVKKMPNHQSARILLSVAKEEEKKMLSLGGSFHQVDFRIADVSNKLQRMFFTSKLEMNSTEIEQAKKDYEELKDVASKLDDRLKDYNNAALEVLKTYSEGRKSGEDDEDFAKRLKKNFEELGAQRKKLMGDPEIMEELLG